ncbi:MAG: hypothetical protein NWE95_07370 [Candidatus Bathyarchaeota archaeon]|nr:hypothetical protein [Candidatus Bathyarchaeota archaeon]
MSSRNRVKHNSNAGLKLDNLQVEISSSVGSVSSFDGVLLESVDQVFSSLGESVKTSIYFHLENTFGISKKDIPARIADFSDALEKIFSQGARHLEIQIMKNLHLKLVSACKLPTSKDAFNKLIVPDMAFRECVRLARQNFKAKTEGNGGSAK